MGLGDSNPSNTFIDNWCANVMNANLATDIRLESCGTGAFPGTACYAYQKGANLAMQAAVRQCRVERAIALLSAQDPDVLLGAGVAPLETTKGACEEDQIGGYVG